MSIEIIVGIIGLFTTVTSGWTSWFFARKKYHSEVDHNHIENMKESLEFYQKLSDDNRDRLEELSKKNNQLENEIVELRKQILDITTNICYSLTCELRQRIREEAIEKLREKKVSNGTKTGKKV